MNKYYYKLFEYSYCYFSFFVEFLIDLFLIIVNILFNLFLGFSMDVNMSFEGDNCVVCFIF